MWDDLDAPAMLLTLILFLRVHRSPSPSRVICFGTPCLLVTLYYLLNWYGKIFSTSSLMTFGVHTQGYLRVCLMLFRLFV